MITFSCHTCRSSLSMGDQFAGQPVRCPTCQTVVSVPDGSIAPPPISRPATSYSGPVRRFGFDCPWCSSRLEATMATAGQEGQCPTCGKNIRIPIIDRYGRLIDPDTHKILKPDPHPVHAYAAAGDRAPKILRAADGTQNIQCSRCNALSPINANSCRSCGIPFTLDGTVGPDRPNGTGFATTSLVLGLLGIPTCLIFVPSILAIVFGVIALLQLRGTESRSAKITAIIGICCGVLGLGFSLTRLL